MSLGVFFDIATFNLLHPVIYVKDYFFLWRTIIVIFLYYLIAIENVRFMCCKIYCIFNKFLLAKNNHGRVVVNPEVYRKRREPTKALQKIIHRSFSKRKDTILENVMACNFFQTKNAKEVNQKQPRYPPNTHTHTHSHTHTHFFLLYRIRI